MTNLFNITITVDQAKRDLLIAAKAIRASVIVDLPTAWAGHGYDAGGVYVQIYSSGCITMPADMALPSDDIVVERKALQDAYNYYQDVRNAARAIAPSLLPDVIYTRTGRSFKRFA